MTYVQPESAYQIGPRICVIGVGGGGGNAVARMIENRVAGVEFLVANTDAQALKAVPAAHRIQLGRDLTQGLGAGSYANIGAAAAVEAMTDIEEALKGVHLCLIAAGMGGGTGTGAAPVIAAAARAKGILTIGVVTKPFSFEGRRRAAVAEAGIQALEKNVDTLIAIPNQNLFRIADSSTTVIEALAMADLVLELGIQSITDLIVNPGMINLDFADIRTVMMETGRAVIGTGQASGLDRAAVAAQLAVSNPLLDNDICGAKGLLISISGSDDMGLWEVDEAANLVRTMVDPEVNIIWGSTFDPALGNAMRVSVLATGIVGEAVATAAAPVAAAFAVPPIAPVAADDTRALHLSDQVEGDPVRLATPEPEIAPRSEPFVLPLAAAIPATIASGPTDELWLDLSFEPLPAERTSCRATGGAQAIRDLRALPTRAAKAPPGPSLFQRMIDLTSSNNDRRVGEAADFADRQRAA